MLIVGTSLLKQRSILQANICGYENSRKNLSDFHPAHFQIMQKENQIKDTVNAMHPDTL
jgi:hypothetical protein